MTLCASINRWLEYFNKLIFIGSLLVLYVFLNLKKREYLKLFFSTNWYMLLCFSHLILRMIYIFFVNKSPFFYTLMKIFSDSWMVTDSFENIKVEIILYNCEYSKTEWTSKQCILRFQVFKLTFWDPVCIMFTMSNW